MAQPRVLKGLDELSPDIRAMIESAFAEEGKAKEREREAGSGSEDLIEFVPDVFVFEVGDVTYEVREPVLEQERQLTRLLKGAKIEFTQRVVLDFEALDKSIEKILGSISPDSALTALDELAPQFFAIIMTPKHQHVKEKNLEEVAEHLRWDLRLSQQIEVARGFFALLTTRGKEALAKVIRRKLAKASL